MKNLLLFLILLVTYCNAQLIYNNNFSDFTFDYPGAEANWVFVDNYSANPLTDINSGYALTVTSGTASYSVASDVYEGGNALFFDGNLILKITDKTILNMGASDFTIVAIYQETAAIPNYGIIAQKGIEWSLAYKSYTLFLNSTNANARVNDGSGVRVYAISTTKPASGRLLMVTDRDTKGYLRTGTTEVSTAISNSVDITDNNYSFTVGYRSDGGTGWNLTNVAVEQIAVYRSALNDNIIDTYINSGMYSMNGLWQNDNFSLMFSDTVYIPLSNFTLPSGKQYRLTFQAKSSDANKNLKCWIGNKSGVREITATSNWSTYTINFSDNFNLANTDTLWFATNSLADTVSIDNVRLKAVTARTGKDFGGWLGW